MHPEPRTVDLVPQAKRLLKERYPQTSGQGLVFERKYRRASDGANVLDVLYAAMEKAGIPRGERARRKADVPFVQDTFARVTLESAALGLVARRGDRRFRPNVYIDSLPECGELRRRCLARPATGDRRFTRRRRGWRSRRLML
jgi:hypothetical protein